MAEKPKSTKSDEELLKLLLKASTQRAELRLMRIGGPRRFRYDVFSFKKKNPNDVVETINALLSPDIRLIKILLANPNGESFLKRLDMEGASTWKIWRVRCHIFLFAENLLSINKVINVALHNEELIWNLGIVGDQETLVTAYGLGTGHDDSAKAQWLKSSEYGSLSTAFYNYFEAISRRNDTIWLECNKNYSKSEPRWPSLFKGNAILAKEEHRDGIEEPQIEDHEVCKICTYPQSNQAEEQWLSLHEKYRKKQIGFRPAKVIRSLDNLRGKGLILECYKGPTLFELSFHLNNLITLNNDGTEKYGGILQMLFKDTLISLSEFQRLSNSVLPVSKRTTYPYAEKLCAALSDIQRHFPKISESIWTEAKHDAVTLGRELESESSVPFRDSHLKNRIWHDDRPVEEIAKSFLQITQEKVSSLITNSVIDIDFETTWLNVTPYDDPFHILFFEHSIYDSNISSEQRSLLLRKYESLFRPNSESYFWRTGLARSLREYCRRLWYRAVMPKTYERRYSMESPDYYLRLSLLCSSRSNGYLKLRRLLEALEVQAEEGARSYNFEEVLSQQESRISFLNNECRDDIISEQPLSPDPSPKNGFKIFIAYAHQDEEYLKKFIRCLVPLKRLGMIDLWHDHEILVGSDWDKKIRKELYDADIIVFLVSYDFLASEYISSVEVNRALIQHESKQSTVVPIIIRAVPLEHTEFSHIQALPSDGEPVVSWPEEDRAWVNIDEGFRKLIIEKKASRSRND